MFCKTVPEGESPRPSVNIYRTSAFTCASYTTPPSIFITKHYIWYRLPVRARGRI